MARILITGGSGFLGGHLAAAAAAAGEDVTATYHAHRPQKGPPMRWMPLDLEDEQGTIEAVRSARPEIVLHAAAMAKPDDCAREPERAERVNMGGSRAMARACAAVDARLVLVSTDLVFDGGAPPYAEDAPVRPLSLYGRTKLLAERAVLEAAPDAAAARVTLLYGRPAIGGTSFSEALRTNWEAGKTMALFADQYRTMIGGANLAAALLELAHSDFRGLIHVGGSERISRLEFGFRLAARLGVDPALIRPLAMADVPALAIRPADVSLEIKLARRILRTPLLDCRKGIEAAYPGTPDNSRHGLDKPRCGPY
jgi:dTDP-4-dehydrorhamnose reductase